MVIAPPAATPSGQIPFWGSYMGQNIFSPDEVNSSQAGQFLSSLQKYDPNAQFVNTTGSDATSPQYQLQFDQSKVPGYLMSKGNDFTTMRDMNPGDYSAVMGGSGNFKGQLFNPSMVKNVSSALGMATPNTNVKQPADTGILGTLDKILPYAVMGTLGIGGGLAGASLAGSLGLGGMGSSIMGSLGKSLIPNLIGMGEGGKFNPMSLLPTLGNMIPGVGGALSGFGNATGLSQLMPYLNLIKNGYGASQGNLGSILNLARLGYNSFGGH
jgi:hypothetical protein